jgi:hypothetical protein
LLDDGHDPAVAKALLSTGLPLHHAAYGSKLRLSKPLIFSGAISFCDCGTWQPLVLREAHAIRRNVHEMYEVGIIRAEYPIISVLYAKKMPSLCNILFSLIRRF